MDALLYSIKLILTFALLFGAPGLLLANSLFRTKICSFATAAIGAALGVAIVTQLAYYFSLIWGFGSGAIVFAWLVSCGLGLSGSACDIFAGPDKALACLKLKTLAPPSRMFWIVAVSAALVGLVGNLTFAASGAVYFPLGFRDIFVREQVIDAVIQTGIPPLNIFANIGQQPILAYHYLFFQSGAMIASLSGVPSSVVFPFIVASTTLIFLSVSFAVANFYFSSRHGGVLYLVVLFCGGLNLCVIAIQALADWRGGMPLRGDIDLWAGTPQVTLLIHLLMGSPHHVLGAAISLVLILLVACVDQLKPSLASYSIAGLALASTVAFSVPLFLSLPPTFIIFGAWLLYNKEYKTLRSLIVICAAGVGLATPYLYQLLANSTQTQLEIGLLAPEFGSLFTKLFGFGLLPRIGNLFIFFFLEFGIILVLAVLGAPYVAWRGADAKLTILLFSYAAISVLVVLFVRSPAENLSIPEFLPIRIGMAIFATAWIVFVFEKMQLNTSMRELVIAALFVQVLCTFYSVPSDLGATFAPSARPAAVRHKAEIEMWSQLELLTDKPSYRIQMFPARLALSNTGITSFVPVFFPRARPLFVNDAALFYGFDRDGMERYLVGLCRLYTGPHELLARQLAMFSFASAMQANRGNPWGPFIRLAMQCIQNGQVVDAQSVVAFAQHYALDFMLVDPVDKLFLKAMPDIKAIIGDGEVMELKNGFLLLKLNR